MAKQDKAENKRVFNKAKEWAESEGYDLTDLMTNVMSIQPQSHRQYSYGNFSNAGLRLASFLHDQKAQKDEKRN